MAATAVSVESTSWAVLAQPREKLLGVQIFVGRESAVEATAGQNPTSNSSPDSHTTENPGIRDGYRGSDVLGRILIMSQAQPCTLQFAYVPGEFCCDGRILRFVWDTYSCP